MRAAAALVLLVLGCNGTAADAAVASEVEATPPPPALPATPATAVPADQPAERPPQGFALVRPGATLHVDADHGVAGFALPTTAVGFAVAVLGREGERIAVETLVDVARHCGDSIPGLSNLRLRLTVAPSDLLAVTTRRVTVEYGDGTGAELLAGMPLVPEGDHWVADPKGLALHVHPPADAVGSYYDPGDREFAQTASVSLGAGDAPLVYDRTRELAEDRLEHTLADGRALALFGVQRVDGHKLGEVRAPCAAIRVQVPTSRADAEAHAASAMGLLAAGEGTRVGGGLLAMAEFGALATPTWRVVAGTSVYWRDGALGGLVSGERSFEVTPMTIGARTCFDVNIGSGQDADRIALCFDASAVHEVPGASPGALDGSAALGSRGWGPPGPGIGGIGELGELGELRGLGELGGLGEPSEPSELGGTPSAGTSPLVEAKPRTSLGAPKISGSLDKDVIRRIVRAHLGEVEACYRKGLAKDPGLAGKATLAFIIGPTGEVRSATIKQDTLSDTGVGRCLQKAAQRWTFPTPAGGGLVAVTYPFVFKAK